MALLLLLLLLYYTAIGCCKCASVDGILSACCCVHITGILKVWNSSGVVYSSQSDCLTENKAPDAAADSLQVVTSAFYCQALDAICVTTHEQNIVFYHRDGLKEFKQVSLSLFHSSEQNGMQRQATMVSFSVL